MGCGEEEIVWQIIHTSDKNPSSDRPPNAFLSSASLYGNSLNGLQIQRQPLKDAKIFICSTVVVGSIIMGIQTE